MSEKFCALCGGLGHWSNKCPRAKNRVLSVEKKHGSNLKKLPALLQPKAS